MTGNITRRGKASWRLKFDVGRDPDTGRRITHYQTVRGTKKQAEAELIRQLAAIDGGTYVEPNKVTVASYMREWIDQAAASAISPKTAERYRELIEGWLARDGHSVGAGAPSPSTASPSASSPK